MLELMNGLKMLERAAENGSDPSLYAEMVLDQFGVDMVKNYLAQPGALDNLARFSSKITTYRPWFDQLVVTLLAEIDEIEAEDHATQAQESAVGNLHTAAHAHNLPTYGHPAGDSGDESDASPDVSTGQGG